MFDWMSEAMLRLVNVMFPEADFASADIMRGMLGLVLLALIIVFFALGPLAWLRGLISGGPRGGGDERGG